MSRGAKLIAEERDRQRRPSGVRGGEGYGRDHDRGHHDELALAGATYALPRFARRPPLARQDSLPETWPWSATAYKPDADRVRELVKAGALIAAAIDSILGGVPRPPVEYAALAAAAPKGGTPMSNGMTFNWDRVTVTVKVWVDNGTTGGEMQEMELPMESFARLLLTSVPSEWFVEPPVSSDLPFFIEYPPVDEVEARVRAKEEPR